MAMRSTTPATGAVMAASIFIASIEATGCPAATRSPTAALTVMTPAKGAATWPGLEVSAFSAAAARMDVEITVPEVSQTLILTRLAGGRTPMPDRETVRGFAEHGVTMALYLSAARNKVLQAELLAGGYPAETPCVVGYRVSWPDELMLRCRLDELSATMAEHKLWKHTVVLVGPALAENGDTRSHLYHPGFRHEYRKAAGEAPIPRADTNHREVRR